MELLCYIHVLGNEPGKRIGIVKWHEIGYYVTDWDSERYTAEDLKEYVHTLNERLGVPDNVAESAYHGSMFGWHVPAADLARAFERTENSKKSSISTSENN